MNRFVVSIILSLIFSFATYYSSHGQRDSTRNPSKDLLNDRILIGGNIGFQFGTVTIIDVSPLVGYKVTDRVIFGLGSTYLYFNDSRFDYSSNIYGGRAFGRYYITSSIFAHTEYEVLNGDWIVGEPRFNINSALVGGGYSYDLGGVAALNFLVLINLNDSEFSPYSNPIFRGGVVFGL